MKCYKKSFRRFSKYHTSTDEWTEGVNLICVLQSRECGIKKQILNYFKIKHYVNETVTNHITG
jgi:hypothetical protein